jgi:glutamate---cysteine ligase / carboxylate-amine ligase
MFEFRFGIEEEYFIVRRRTASVVSRLSEPFIRKAKKELGANLMLELLQSQIEVATTPVNCSRAARLQLTNFRSILSEIGRKHDLGIVAAGTHPLAYPHEQRMTHKRRYAKVGEDLGMVAWGNPICGLHVHVEVPDPAQRMALVHRLVPHLPLLLALSTSSPFWAGCNTGLLGYRNAANDAFPRSGFPEMFVSMAEYEAYVQALVDAHIIRDSTYIWWALRPSLRHPTLELRITDCCTYIEDTIAIAALYRALVRHFARNPASSVRFCPVSRALVEENRWRAQRYGTDGSYLDLTTRQAIPFSVLLDNTLNEVADDIHELGLADEIAHLRAIKARGTSAHQQLRLYTQLRNEGHSRNKAMREVAKWLRCCSETGGLPVEDDCKTPWRRHHSRTRISGESMSSLAVSGCRY